MEQNGLSSFGILSPKEHSCIIISKSMNWLRRRSRLKVFLFFALAAILFNGAELLSNFGRQSPKEHSCEIISKSVKRFSRKSIFLFIALAAILFNVAEFFEQFWKRVTQETFLCNYFKIHLLVREKKSFKGCSIFSSGGHLVQRRGKPKEPSCKIISKSV